MSTKGYNKCGLGDRGVCRLIPGLENRDGCWLNPETRRCRKGMETPKRMGPRTEAQTMATRNLVALNRAKAAGKRAALPTQAGGAKKQPGCMLNPKGTGRCVGYNGEDTADCYKSPVTGVCRKNGAMNGPKRQATPAQLAALAKGRATRQRNAALRAQGLPVPAAKRSPTKRSPTKAAKAAPAKPRRSPMPARFRNSMGFGNFQQTGGFWW